MTTQQFGNLKLTRVEYMTLPLPPEFLGLTPEQLVSLSWACEPWVANEQINISAAAWFLEVNENRIVIDPVQAVDALLRADPEAELHHQTAIEDRFFEAGFAVDSIHYVLMSHIEDVGAVAKRVDGKWHAFFPNARILLSDKQLSDFLTREPEPDEIDKVHGAWQSLIEQGLVDTFGDGEEIFPAVIAEVTNKHQEGHCVFHLNQGEATFTGHLAVTPVHMGTGPCSELNQMPELVFEQLHQIARDGRKLIGPLWPAPGIGRWLDDRLVPE